MSIATANIQAVDTDNIHSCDACGHDIAANIVYVDRLPAGWVEVKNDNVREPRLVFDGDAVYCAKCYTEDVNGCIRHADLEG